MQKIYGYRGADVIALAKIISSEKNKGLTEIFENYSLQTGKAVGTVKNLYYALVRLSQTDQEFCEKYLNGKPLTVVKNCPFTLEQEKWLFDEITKGVKNGQSVRAIVYSLANGDIKLALRYQNKYRSMLVKNPEVARQIRSDRQQIKEIKDFSQVPDTLMQKLKREIDGLIEKIALKERKENDFLRRKIALLESENLRLSKLLYGGSVESQAIDYFSSPTGINTIN